MWIILEHKGIAKSLRGVPVQVRKKYEFWKNIVRHSGPEGLRDIKGFHDEALAGQWAGSRSSRLNEAYRVIYSIQQAFVTVYVERSSKHDYRA
ncbi:MAG TPA: hypothetical protein VGP93_14800 [Polyangiaceae bacterium]|nr:hypothetical protein [Polyangiaceae bacterium]